MIPPIVPGKRGQTGLPCHGGNVASQDKKKRGNARTTTHKGKDTPLKRAIKDYRKIGNVSERALADELGISTATLRRLQSGKFKIREDTARRLAQILCRSVSIHEKNERMKDLLVELGHPGASEATTLRTVCYAENPVLAMTATGRPDGFTIELIELLRRVMGFEMIEFEFRELRDPTTTIQSHLFGGLLVRTPRRIEQLDFSMPLPALRVAAYAIVAGPLDPEPGANPTLADLFVPERRARLGDRVDILAARGCLSSEFAEAFLSPFNIVPLEHYKANEVIDRLAEYDSGRTAIWLTDTFLLYDVLETIATERHDLELHCLGNGEPYPVRRLKDLAEAPFLLRDTVHIGLSRKQGSESVDRALVYLMGAMTTHLKALYRHHQKALAPIAASFEGTIIDLPSRAVPQAWEQELLQEIESSTPAQFLAAPIHPVVTAAEKKQKRRRKLAPSGSSNLHNSTLYDLLEIAKERSGHTGNSEFATDVAGVSSTSLAKALRGQKIHPRTAHLITRAILRFIPPRDREASAEKLLDTLLGSLEELKLPAFADRVNIMARVFHEPPLIRLTYQDAQSSVLARRPEGPLADIVEAIARLLGRTVTYGATFCGNPTGERMQAEPFDLFAAAMMDTARRKADLDFSIALPGLRRSLLCSDFDRKGGPSISLAHLLATEGQGCNLVVVRGTSAHEYVTQAFGRATLLLVDDYTAELVIEKMRGSENAISVQDDYLLTSMIECTSASDELAGLRYLSENGRPVPIKSAAGIANADVLFRDGVRLGMRKDPAIKPMIDDCLTYLYGPASRCLAGIYHNYRKELLPFQRRPDDRPLYDIDERIDRYFANILDHADYDEIPSLWQSEAP